MPKSERKYEVSILESEGSCKSNLFEKMAKRGDLTSTKLANVIGCEVEIVGYAKVKIVTDEKEFELMYIDTNEYGLVSTGSEIFYDSVKEYLEDTKQFILKEVKTKKGKTYKAVPKLKNDGKVSEESVDDLPF